MQFIEELQQRNRETFLSVDKAAKLRQASMQTD
jgi:hypothetical protein